MSINQILEQSNIDSVDFVSIDVEGQEMAVLYGFDLQKYCPHLLVIEYSNDLERREMLQFMKKEGYFKWIDNGQDIFFVQEPRIDHLRVLLWGLWQSFKSLKQVKSIVAKIKYFKT
jgi:hypothetical protein